MSYYVEFVGKRKIKQEYRQDLQYFLHKEFDKMQTDRFLQFFDEFKNDEHSAIWFFDFLKLQEHIVDCIEEYSKITPSYENGIFTYKFEINTSGCFSNFYIRFLFLLDDIEKERIFHDVIDEDRFEKTITNRKQ